MLERKWRMPNCYSCNTKKTVFAKKRNVEQLASNNALFVETFSNMFAAKQSANTNDEDSSDVSDESDFESDMEEEDQEPKQFLKAAHRSLSLPVLEECVVGKWYARVYTTKRSTQLFIIKSQSDS